jgi:hypothetical protein
VARAAQTRYPGRLLLAFTNIRPLIALGRLDEVNRLITDNVQRLRNRGVALAMLGRRAEAEAVDQALERSTRPIRPDDRCTFWAVCRRAARAPIAAALGDKARAVGLIDLWSFRTDFEAHFELLGELLKDYPPFQALIKPKG